MPGLTGKRAVKSDIPVHAAHWRWTKRSLPAGKHQTVVATDVLCREAGVSFDRSSRDERRSKIEVVGT